MQKNTVSLIFLNIYRPPSIELNSFDSAWNENYLWLVITTAGCILQLSLFSPIPQNHISPFITPKKLCQVKKHKKYFKN